MIKDFIWQYIDPPEEEVINMQNLYRAAITEYVREPFSYFQWLKLDVTHFMGLELKQTFLIQSPPMAPGVIHQDGDWNLPPGLALNIPLENCETAVTEFWESDIEPSLWYTPQVGDIPSQATRYHKHEDCRKIDEFTLTRPIIFNHSVSHCVRNDGPNWRRSISLRFKEEPWHLIKS